MNELKKIDEKIDFKLDYMATMFRKISHKRFETYVIQRIWHRLNDNEIQFVTQQYVDRPKNDEDALVDLYLPQVNMVVEINEPFHYMDEVKKKHDKLRNKDVEQVTKSEVIEVDCRGTIEEVNQQIEVIVEKIRAKKKEKVAAGKFYPWLGISKDPLVYFTKKGYFDITENEYVKTIDDICDIFHTKAKHRGYLRAGSARLYDNTELWFPNTESGQWNNILSDDGTYILEYPNDKAKLHDWLQEVIRDNNRRITFLRHKDDLGFKYYKFVGVFEIDKARSKAENKGYWKRVADRVSLKEEMEKCGK